MEAGAEAVEAFFGRPRPPVAFRGDLRGEADVEEAVFCRLAAGAFLGEAGELLLRGAGLLLVPVETRLGPLAAAEADVAVVLFLGAALVVFLAVVVAFLVPDFLVAAFLVVDFLVPDLVVFLVVAFFLAPAFLVLLAVEALACLFRFFNSCRPASAIL